MFSNIKISRRLILLISVLTAIFITTGALSLMGMTEVTKETAKLNVKTAEAAEFTRISASVRHGLVDVGRELSSGALTWSEARSLLVEGAKEFDRLWGS